MSSSSSSSSSSTQPLSSTTITPVSSNVVADIDAAGPSRNINTTDQQVEQPSSSTRQRAMNEVWLEPVVEALATQVAIDASLFHGPLSAASALAIIFQVCSTWREVSRSDLLWQRLTRRIWRRTYRLRDTWQLEYIYCHRTARNFTIGRHALLLPQFNLPQDHTQTLICRCLTLSDTHLACGFVDGTVRLFDLITGVLVTTFWSNHGLLFGPFSQSISGIVISNSILSFARLDGDIFVALINGPGPGSGLGLGLLPGPIHSRRAISGDVVNNGVLVEFAGCNRWWVGLFAGHAGSAFQIWDARTEQRVFVGGSLTDPETVQGWHMLTELIEPVGRVRVTEGEFVVACTCSRLVCFNLRNPEILLMDVGSTTGFMVGSFDVSHEVFVVVERNGVGTVRRVNDFERVSRFMLRGSWLRGLLGCMNLGYVITYSGVSGLLRVWDIHEPAARLCVTLPVRDDDGDEVHGHGNGMVANQTHVAISYNDSSIHLLDFSVQ